MRSGVAEELQAQAGARPRVQLKLVLARESAHAAGAVARVAGWRVAEAGGRCAACWAMPVLCLCSPRLLSLAASRYMSRIKNVRIMHVSPPAIRHQEPIPISKSNELSLAPSLAPSLSSVT